MTRLIDADALLTKLNLLYISNTNDRTWIESIITNAPTVQSEGWVSVPIEPTQDMCQQGQWKANEWKQFPLRITSIYKAMIQAAPTDKE